MSQQALDLLDNRHHALDKYLNARSMPNPKYLSHDARIHSIVEKHVTALSREIAQVLTQSLLDSWGSADTPAVAPVPPPSNIPEPPEPPESHNATALIYDAKARKWTCPRCGRFADLRRRAVTTHLRFCEALQVPSSSTLKSAKARKPRRKSAS